MIFPTENSFLSSKNWCKNTCGVCHNLYYAKTPGSNCNSYTCAGAYVFLEDPKPRRFWGIKTGIEKMRFEMNQKKYPIHPPLSIIRHKERTLFISTGGQLYDPYVYAKKTTSVKEKWAIIQPVIRLQGVPLIGKTDGFSTSFVHASIERWGANFEEYLETLDEMIDIISNFGIHASHLTLKIKEEINNWMGLRVPAFSFKINYRGLEIGIANYFYDFGSDRTHNSFCDVGVGLERLLWARNKTSYYFDSIGPASLSLHNYVKTADSIRTSTLILASGFNNEFSKHKSKLNTLVSRIPDNIDLCSYVNYYISQWSLLTEINNERKDVYAMMRRKVDVKKVTKTLNILSRKQKYGLSFEELLQELIENNQIKIDTLRKL